MQFVITFFLFYQLMVKKFSVDIKCYNESIECYISDRHVWDVNKMHYHG